MIEKITIWSIEFPPIGGGTGIVAKQVLDYFLTITNKDVKLVTKFVKHRDIHPNSLIQISGRKPYWVLKLIFKLLIDKSERNIFNDPVMFLLAGLFLRKSQLQKSLFFFHGSEPEFLFNTKIKKILTRISFLRLRNSGVKICVHGKSLRTRLIDVLKKQNISIEQENIQTVYFGYDDSVFNKNGHVYDFCRLHGLDYDSFVILTVSRIVKGKGFLEMLEVFSDLKKLNSKFKWFIAGDGPYLHELKQRINDLDLDECVYIIGKVEKERLAEMYRGANVFLLLSNLKESFGLVYLEAQACGLPVIGYDAYGAKESIIDGNGWLVKDADQAVEIILNYSKKMKIYTNGYLAFSSSLLLPKVLLVN